MESLSRRETAYSEAQRPIASPSFPPGCRVRPLISEDAVQSQGLPQASIIYLAHLSDAERGSW